MMKLKPGVRLTGAQPQLSFAAFITYIVFLHHDVEDMTITSVCDGQHSRQSLHYVGHAFDVRISETPLHKREAIVLDMKKALGEEFDVILEATHIHVEWQPKR